ncbi:FdrA family protein [Pseudonocardia bannensis]|uniref:FdrA family protein n=2 Tax=Pseudonocardiaceae TaxID=2070 RepID=A0A848DKD6_9PSEU|nr:FdrA family protein [Pseudonocardia bannensis]
MRVSRRVGRLEGVGAALVAMASELNLELLAGMGFAPPRHAGINDLLVAIRAQDEDALQAALATTAEALTARPAASASAGDVPAPRTVGAASRSVGGGALVLLSLPGQYVFAEAVDAVESGRDVMVFSDNMPLAQEVRLKEIAAEHGRLVMGPDCGTAVVRGTGLGFANAVDPGPVGIVAASGTGAQQVLTLLDAAGVGVSALLGVGGRDLSTAVAGRSTVTALDALDADPDTELIMVVSKPPAAEIAAAVRAHAATLRTPVQFALLGRGRPDLTAAVEAALNALGRAVPRWPSWGTGDTPAARPGALRGLYTGGTLCDEAMVIASEALGAIRSNIPLEPEWALPDSLRAPGHLMIDFGDDALTVGRPHPMIDPSQRLARIADEAVDPECGVLLLDVVLGHAAHDDPAAELAPAVRAGRETARARGAELPVVISLVGSERDPQGTSRQAETLRDAGAEVFASNAQAVRHAVSLLTPGGTR